MWKGTYSQGQKEWMKEKTVSLKIWSRWMGDTDLADPRKLDQRPVVGKDKELPIFVPQKHPEDPGIDGTSDLWRWRLGWGWKQESVFKNQDLTSSQFHMAVAASLQTL